MRVRSLFRLDQKASDKDLADKDTVIAIKDVIIGGKHAAIADTSCELEVVRITERTAQIAAKKTVAEAQERERELQRRIDELILRDAATGRHP